MMRGSRGAKEPRFSLTAFTLPGRVTTRVLFRVPATGRDSTASGVYLRPPWNIACTTPGASLGSTHSTYTRATAGEGGRARGGQAGWALCDFFV